MPHKNHRFEQSIKDLQTQISNSQVNEALLDIFGEENKGHKYRITPLIDEQFVHPFLAMRDAQVTGVSLIALGTEPEDAAVMILPPEDQSVAAFKAGILEKLGHVNSLVERSYWLDVPSLGKDLVKGGVKSLGAVALFESDDAAGFAMLTPSVLHNDPAVSHYAGSVARQLQLEGKDKIKRAASFMGAGILYTMISAAQPHE